MGKGPTQGLGEHSLTAEKMYSINFSATGKRFCLSLHYNGAKSYLFVNGTEMIKFKTKYSELESNILCLGNISRTNETRHIKWHEMCKCKCRLDSSACNNKQRWNDDKCLCKCKELFDKGIMPM